MFSAGVNGNRGCVKKLRKFKLPAHTKITSKPRKTNHATLKCDPGYFFSKGKNINFLACSRLTNFSSKQIPKCKGKSVRFHVLFLYVRWHWTGIFKVTISENVKIHRRRNNFTERERFWPYSTPQLSTRSYRPSGCNIKLLLQRHIYTYNLY